MGRVGHVYPKCAIWIGKDVGGGLSSYLHFLSSLEFVCEDFSLFDWVMQSDKVFYLFIFFVHDFITSAKKEEIISFCFQSCLTFFILQSHMILNNVIHAQTSKSSDLAPRLSFISDALCKSANFQPLQCKRALYNACVRCLCVAHKCA